jgi:hypothetical protein
MSDQLEVVNIHIDIYDRMFADWAIKIFGRATDDASAMKRFDSSIGLQLSSHSDLKDHLSFDVIDKRRCLVARLKYEF